MAAWRAVVAEAMADQAWVARAVDGVTTRIHRELTELGTTAQSVARTRASVEANVLLFHSMISGGLDPSQAEVPPVALAYLRTAVRRGASIGALLRSYQIAHEEFWQRWVRRISDRGGLDDLAEVLLAGSEYMLRFIGALCARLTEHWTIEREEWDRTADAIRAGIVHDLLAGALADVERASSRLGYDVRREHLAFLVWDSPGPGGEPSAGARGAARQFARDLGGDATLLVPLDEHTIAGWVGARRPWPAPVPPNRPRAVPPPGVHVALGGPGGGVSGFTRSHREALWARRVAQLHAGSAPVLTSYDQVALLALASADAEQAVAFVERVLGPLAGAGKQTGRLAETARVYLDELGSPQQAARRLGVHENTVTNRLRAAGELIGRPITHEPADLLIALTLLPLLPGMRGRAEAVG
jgi:transposase-like protein